jgi:multidrug resistance efflux pump
MHQYLEEKPEYTIKTKVLAAVGVGVFICALLFLLFNKNSGIPKEYNQLLAVKSKVESAQITGIGAIVPHNKVLISAPSKGHILSLQIRAGQVVQKGQVLTKIKNYELERDLQEAKYYLVNLRSEVTLKKSDLQIRKNKLETDLMQRINTKKKQKLELDAYNKLVEKGIISKIKFLQSQMTYEQASLDVISYERQLSWFNDNLQQQIDALNTKVEAAIEQFNFIKNRMDSLTVKAAHSGIVKEVNFYAGQVVTQGQNLFEVIDHAKLQAKIQIPQYSSSHLFVNQKAQIVTPNGDLEAKVEHVDSVIRQGSVSIYLSFLSKVPEWIKVDQSVEAIISTDKIDERLFIERPPSFDDYSDWSFYLVDKKGDTTKLLAEYLVGEDKKIYIQSGVTKGDQLLAIPSVYNVEEVIKI